MEESPETGQAANFREPVMCLPLGAGDYVLSVGKRIGGFISF